MSHDSQMTLKRNKGTKLGAILAKRLLVVHKSKNVKCKQAEELLTEAVASTSISLSLL